EKPSQALCREKRQAFFDKYLGENDRLFLAHHLDDQAETLLLRLMRGSGIHGLKGMAAANGKKVRPLLKVSREEILAAARDWKLSWREDSSNRSLKYERNWVRHEVLPLLESRRPGVARRIA